MHDIYFSHVRNRRFFALHKKKKYNIAEIVERQAIRKAIKQLTYFTLKTSWEVHFIKIYRLVIVNFTTIKPRPNYLVNTFQLIFQRNKTARKS